MTQQGFEDYIINVYGKVNGTTKSYITAIRIIDQLFSYDDVFDLKGKSVTCIEEPALLNQIADFVFTQQTLFKKGEKSFFGNINPKQTSYPGKGFCSAAMSQLLNYNYSETEKAADNLIAGIKNNKIIAKKLSTFFNLDKEGSYIEVTTRARVGQDYFRKMILSNYQAKCCVTGLNVPTTLRASHIVEWSKDKTHRMDPENGLCLSATYDAAFDKHLISFDDDYRMIISKEIKDYYTSAVTQEYFQKFEGRRMTLPIQFMPNKLLLEKHRNQLVG